MIIVDHKTFRDNRGSYIPMGLEIRGKEWKQGLISINDGRYTFRVYITKQTHHKRNTLRLFVVQS